MTSAESPSTPWKWCPKENESSWKAPVSLIMVNWATFILRVVHDNDSPTRGVLLWEPLGAWSETAHFWRCGSFTWVLVVSLRARTAKIGNTWLETEKIRLLNKNSKVHYHLNSSNVSPISFFHDFSYCVVRNSAIRVRRPTFTARF